MINLGVNYLKNNSKQNKLLDYILNLDEILGYVTLTMVVAFTALNVILRYCFKFTISSAEEITLIAFIWASYIGSAAAYKSEEHIAIDIIVNKFPKKLRYYSELAINIFIIIISMSYTYLGIVLCMNAGSKTTLVLRLPYILVDVSIVISFGLMTIYGILKLIRRIKGLSPVLRETGIMDPMNNIEE